MIMCNDDYCEMKILIICCNDYVKNILLQHGYYCCPHVLNLSTFFTIEEVLISLQTQHKVATRMENNNYNQKW